MRKKIYFNTAKYGLVSSFGLKKAHLFNRGLTQADGIDPYAWMATHIPKIQRDVAVFLGCPDSELAFISNFSYGIQAVLGTVKKQHSKVLLLKEDYPSLTLPFELNDFEITWLDSNNGFDFDLNEIKSTILSRKIEVLAVSHVQWLTGYKIDIEELGQFCKEHGVVFIVDATQSMGVENIDFSNLFVDVLMASNYKWMNAGFGSGTMCMKTSFLENYSPIIGGFGSYTLRDDELVYEPSIRSYQPGHLPLSNLILLQQAVNEKMEFGLPISTHISQLIDHFFDGLNNSNISIVGPKNSTHRGGIVCIRSQEGLYAWLETKGIVATERNNAIRLAFHYTNTISEVDELIDAFNTFKNDHH